MRIILVEDEPKTREGIINIIQKHTGHKIISVAENGEEGIRALEKEQPDLIISDIRMPGMNGLEMLQKMREKGFDTGVIFISGYSEFEYAQQALKLHAMDYVLKPVDVENFLQVLQNVENKLKKKKTEQISPEQMLWDYVNGRQENREFFRERLENKLGINERVQVSLLYVYPESQTKEAVNEMIYDTRECLDSQCIQDYYIVPVSHENAYTVLIVDTEKNTFLKWVLENRVVSSLLENTDFICSYGTAYGIGNLPEVLKELKELLVYGFHLEKGKIIDRELAHSIEFEKKEYPGQLEMTIQKEIWKQDKEKIRQAGEQFVHEIIESRMHPDEIREYTIRFSAGILKAGMEKNQEDDEKDSQYIMSSMLRSYTARQLTYQFEKILKAAFCDLKKVDITENDMVLKVIAFIRENYARDISLSEAAELCNVSAEYLSRLFQQETGAKFTAFLQNFRISIAKRMLLDSKKKVYEVAEAVGYHDQKYFVSVFKKLCGMTPSEFRKERGV